MVLHSLKVYQSDLLPAGQAEALKLNKPLMVVGTPGRLTELSRMGRLQTHNCPTLVLDEVLLLPPCSLWLLQCHAVRWSATLKTLTATICTCHRFELRKSHHALGCSTLHRSHVLAC